MTGVNPVGGAWTPSSYGPGSGSAYPLNIDAMISVQQRWGQAFNPHASSPGAMTLSVDPGMVFYNGALTELALQTTGTITAPVSHPRIDRVVRDVRTGTISVVTGTEAASPTAPAIPSGKVPVAQVLLQTTSTVITNSMITDERVWHDLPVPGELPTKASPTGSDLVVIGDAAAGDAPKNATITSILALATPGGLHNETLISSTGTSTLVAGAGVDIITAQIQAAGGGAGGENAGTPGYPGGSGASAVVLCKVTGGATLTLTNGTGGAGGSGNVAGSLGGNVTLSSSGGGSITLSGGLGGSNASGATPGAGGALVSMSPASGFTVLALNSGVSGPSAAPSVGAASFVGVGGAEGTTGTNGGNGTLGSGGGTPNSVSGSHVGGSGGNAAGLFVW